jgi:hypothetical protein
MAVKDRLRGSIIGIEEQHQTLLVSFQGDVTVELVVDFVEKLLHL